MASLLTVRKFSADTAYVQNGNPYLHGPAKAGVRLFSHSPEWLCDYIFVFYALWTLTWIVAYYAGLSFTGIAPLFVLLLPLSASVVAIMRSTRKQTTPIPVKFSPRDALVVFIFVTAGILLTLFLHRPDGDDELYLAIAVALLGDAHLPIQQNPHSNLGFYAFTAYEPLKAMVSYVTGLPLLTSYYLVVPALMSGLTVMVTCRLLRELIPDGWIIGMLFFFVVMLAWGDVHRTQANFGFVRMFHGKSVLVSAVVPALLLYFFLIRTKGQPAYNTLLLIATMISGVGFSRGGLIIGPLVVLFLSLASINFFKLRKLTKRMLVFMVPLAAILLVYTYHSGWSLMNPSQLVYTGRGNVSSTTTLEMIQFTMGDGFRAIFLLMCVGLSFLFVENRKIRYFLMNFLAIFFILLLIPWTSDFFAKTMHQYLSWRWMWVMPVPALASVSVGGAWTGIRQIGNSGIAVGVFVFVVIGFTAAGRVVVSAANRTSVQWPDAKIDGDTIYLEPYNEKATIKNEALWLKHYEKGF